MENKDMNIFMGDRIHVPIVQLGQQCYTKSMGFCNEFESKPCVLVQPSRDFAGNGFAEDFWEFSWSRTLFGEFASDHGRNSSSPTTRSFQKGVVLGLKGNRKTVILHNRSGDRVAEVGRVGYTDDSWASYTDFRVSVDAPKYWPSLRIPDEAKAAHTATHVS